MLHGPNRGPQPKLYKRAGVPVCFSKPTPLQNVGHGIHLKTHG